MHSHTQQLWFPLNCPDSSALLKASLFFYRSKAKLLAGPRWGLGGIQGVSHDRNCWKFSTSYT